MSLLDSIKSLFSKEENYVLWEVDHGEPILIQVDKWHGQYRPLLIGNFKQEHQILLDIFGNLVKAIDERKISKVRANFHALHAQLLHHLKEEEKYFYLYLDRLYKSDSEKYQDEIIFVEGMQKEMQTIVGQIEDIKATYYYNKITDDDLSNLKKNLLKITPILTHRIKKEEGELYPLYKKPE